MKAFLREAWSHLKAVLRGIATLFLRYPLALAATVALVAMAAFCLAGGKTLQIGGLLQKIWGVKVPGTSPATVAPGRTGEDGKPIDPGQSDDKGYVQAPVSTQIVEPGIFSDPNTVTVVHPEKGQVTVALPTGVKNKDVKEVVEVSPDVYEVRNRDTGVKAKDLDDFIKKAGG